MFQVLEIFSPMKRKVDLNKDYDSNIVRCPDSNASNKMINLITDLKSKETQLVDKLSVL